MSYMIYSSVRSIRSFIIIVSNFLATSYYRLVCSHFGRNSKVEWGVWINYPASVSIGDNVRLGRGCRIYSEVEGATLSIGAESEVNPFVEIDFSGGILIGKRVVISSGVKISTHSHGHNPFSLPDYIPKEIQDEAWIGERSLVLHSCTVVGRGAIIGAGCVAAKVVEANEVIVGASVRKIDKITHSDNIFQSISP